MMVSREPSSGTGRPAIALMRMHFAFSGSATKKIWCPRCVLFPEVRTDACCEAADTPLDKNMSRLDVFWQLIGYFIHDDAIALHDVARNIRIAFVGGVRYDLPAVAVGGVIGGASDRVVIGSDTARTSAP